MTPYWVYYVRLGRPHYHSRSPIMTIRFQGGKIDPYLDQLIDDYRSNPHNKDGLRGFIVKANSFSSWVQAMIPVLEWHLTRKEYQEYSTLIHSGYDIIHKISTPLNLRTEKSFKERDNLYLEGKKKTDTFDHLLASQSYIFESLPYWDQIRNYDIPVIEDTNYLRWFATATMGVYVTTPENSAVGQPGGNKKANTLFHKNYNYQCPIVRYDSAKIKVCIDYQCRLTRGKDQKERVFSGLGDAIQLPQFVIDIIQRNEKLEFPVIHQPLMEAL